jgi:KDO2-lipid IV(A) lauroyltransferase
MGYYLLLPLTYLVSILPPFLLNGVADFFYILIYYVFGYRKKVVTENLKKSFPKKSEAEIKAIRRKFYRYFCDLILEVFKTLTISKKKMLDYCEMDKNALTLFEKYYSQNKNIIIVMGHYGNWEWAGNSFTLMCNYQLHVIYHPLQNKKFNDLIVNMRTRFGTKLIEMKNTYKDMLKNKTKINATAFIADQTPHPDKAYWTKFLNQDTPIFQGTGIIAKKLNYPIIYVSVKRIKRGKYKIYAEPLTDNPSSLTENEISELHTQRLEKDIIAQPEIWLWTHRRWKHKRPN